MEDGSLKNTDGVFEIDALGPNGAEEFLKIGKVGIFIESSFFCFKKERDQLNLFVFIVSTYLGLSRRKLATPS